MFSQTHLYSHEGAAGEFTVVGALLGQGPSVNLSNAAGCNRVLLEPVKHDADGLLEGCLNSMPGELK